MRFNDLQSWLSWQESLHTAEIELGLDRIQQVASAMGLSSNWSVPVITVAGTNGKGSSVAILESIYQQAGYRVGSYTSPHLLHYNERIKINRTPVSDDLLCLAFDKVDQARKQGDKEISLTYFEFGTLAALSILKDAELDIVILEVGLGGRLDAVNIVNATVALITPVAIDHQSWLGNTREEIAEEKAGIIKKGSLVVCSDPLPASAVLNKTIALEAKLFCLKKDFKPEIQTSQWQYQTVTKTITNIPMPSLIGIYQIDNAAAAIQVSELLTKDLPVSDDAIKNAMTDIQLSARFQCIAEGPDVYIDVAHNAHATKSLSDNLKRQSCEGRTLAVLAMLEDKAICEALEQLDTQIDRYYLAGLEGNRGMSAEQMKLRIQDCVSSDKLCLNNDVEAALQKARAEATEDDRIIVFGSFLTVAAAMQTLMQSEKQDLGI